MKPRFSVLFPFFFHQNIDAGTYHFNIVRARVRKENCTVHIVFVQREVPAVQQFKFTNIELMAIYIF